MIQRRSDSLLLQPCDVHPSQVGLQVIGVFNPAVAMLGDEYCMLARVAERPSELRAGWTPLPRWRSGTTEVDWIRDEDLTHVDARVVAMKNSGDLRLTSASHLQIFRSMNSGGERWEAVAALLPEGPWEEYGIEDPRITRIDNTYWITYVAVSRSGAATALMSSTDLLTFHRHGIIFPSENKDVVLFPDMIAGDFVALHRPNPNSHFCPPQIWLARSPDMIHWGRHEFVLGGVHAWEGDRVGSGTPPILCDEGWLTLYHGSTRSTSVGTVGCYSAGALLLDRDQPGRVLGRSSEPIMQPTTAFELNGFVPNVVFPTAMLDRGDELQVFYGAADACVASACFSKQSVLDSLQRKTSAEYYNEIT
ncbi:glycoside hydrolase family 130 protein [Aporhodopirellula aestuarii]|uniref:Glycoside hydrolase family 130 protein n=1 Tax=Aporhodopirellula aestuarii TaxID=2950107 RepID=A0ABT0UDC5_9BACT|nr:glycoside hydrolase family 130 protein [Aporhodopirellula aestuarii]MCM2375043.1 glycoside hydrolase family 130 protein [Aporhodopirellula aestuarii]